jgi:hypothetical protein
LNPFTLNAFLSCDETNLRGWGGGVGDCVRVVFISSAAAVVCAGNGSANFAAR